MKIAWSCYAQRRKDGFLTEGKWQFWDNTFQFCSYLQNLTTHRRLTYLFGHNVFFDLQVSDFFYYFTKWGWVLDFVYDQGLTFILSIHRGDKKIKAISTTNYFDTSLKELGKIVGLEKIEVDFDISTPEELKAYCRRDVEIVKQVVEKYFDFVKAHDLGKFSLTKASQAFAAYRHRFMDKKINIHEVPEVIALERDAYIGGRIECFQLGEIEGGPFLSLDVNSMFPYVMKEAPLPTRLIDYRKDIDLEFLIPFLKKFCCIARVDLETDVPLYPLRSEKKIIFPIGKFRTVLCSCLLGEALHRGHLKRVTELAAYEEDSIFTEYVNYFYALRWKYREEGNLVFELLVKYLLNSLYGKFAQWIRESREVEDITCEGYYRNEILNLTTGLFDIEYKLFNKIIYEYGEKPAKNTLIAIPAHITEWARHIIWSIIEGIGPEKVIYCDTDSIKIRKSDLQYLKYPLDPKKLGSLKIEEETDHLTVLGPKMYLTDHGQKIKGIPQAAKKIGEKSFEFLSFGGLNASMRSKTMRWVTAEKVTKELRQEYDKGIVLPDGRTQPFVLQEF